MSPRDEYDCSPGEDDGPEGETLIINNSVGVGGRNEMLDTRRIQSALNNVPYEEGGPSPLLDVDGLVGQLTNRAIYRFQQTQFGAAKADGRVDPNQYTIERLRDFQPAYGFDDVGSGGSGGSAGGTVKQFGGKSKGKGKGKSKNVMTDVHSCLPMALSWIQQAIKRLDEANAYLKGTLRPSQKDAFEMSLRLVDRCFDVRSQGSKAIQDIQRIRGIYAAMHFPIAASIGGKTTHFKKAPGGCGTAKRRKFAWTFAGGYHKRDSKGNVPMSNPEYSGPNVPQNAIYICTKNVASFNTEDLVDLIVHELSHFVGPIRTNYYAIGDHAYGLSALKSKYDVTVRTASNHAWLAWLARLPMSQWLTNKG